MEKQYCLMCQKLLDRRIITSNTQVMILGWLLISSVYLNRPLCWKRKQCFDLSSDHDTLEQFRQWIRICLLGWGFCTIFCARFATAFEVDDQYAAVRQFHYSQAADILFLHRTMLTITVGCCVDFSQRNSSKRRWLDYTSTTRNSGSWEWHGIQKSNELS